MKVESEYSYITHIPYMCLYIVHLYLYCLNLYYALGLVLCMVDVRLSAVRKKYLQKDIVSKQYRNTST